MIRKADAASIGFFLLIILLKMGFRHELGPFLRKVIKKTWKLNDFSLKTSLLMTFLAKTQ